MMIRSQRASGRMPSTWPPCAAEYGSALEKITRRVDRSAPARAAWPAAPRRSTRRSSTRSPRPACTVTTSLEVEGGRHPAGTYVSKSGCQGFCQMGPLVTIEPDGILYTRVKPDDVAEIVEDHAAGPRRGRAAAVRRSRPAAALPRAGARFPFYKQQQRTVLQAVRPDRSRRHPRIHPQRRLRRRRGRPFASMTPEAICDEMIRSGLRGRGGGGFPTGRKWELTRRQPGEKKYVICNGDEGDPGAFMDRSVMEGNPHSVIEGMMIAARAIGADEGYVYVRAEYPLAVKRIAQCRRGAAEDSGLLGDNVFGSGHGFRVQVMEGAGAFVCGEETALMGSIEGKRGMPRPKPPFPAQSGLWGKPTVINNVETLATVPLVMRHGRGRLPPDRHARSRPAPRPSP